jgi:hypothetical protein
MVMHGFIDRNRPLAVGGEAVTTGDDFFGERHARRIMEIQGSINDTGRTTLVDSGVDIS